MSSFFGQNKVLNGCQISIVKKKITLFLQTKLQGTSAFREGNRLVVWVGWFFVVVFLLIKDFKCSVYVEQAQLASFPALWGLHVTCDARS